MRRAILLVGSLFLSFSIAAQVTPEELAASDLEMMRSMSAEESFSYVRRTYTMRSMEVLGKMLETWRLAHGRYPDAQSADALRGTLAGTFDHTKIPISDKWGTEFRYLLAPGGKQYRIVSAGGDRIFDERSWARRGDLPTDDDDAVLAGGTFVRRWTDATKPGLGERAKLNAAARAHLSRADARIAADDRSGALAAYIEAVKADAGAADLKAIRRYAPFSIGGALPPPPPPPPPPPGGPAPPGSPPPKPHEAAPAETELHIAALRQYLDLHPGHEEATLALIGILPPAEALAAADAYVATRVSDPDAYVLRAGTRSSAGRTLDALADFEKAASLDPSNAMRQYQIGVMAYEIAAKPSSLAATEVREQLRRSLAALERAETLRSNYAEAMVYRSLVLRKMAELETDAAARRKLLAEADEARTRATEVLKGASRR